MRAKLAHRHPLFRFIAFLYHRTHTLHKEDIFLPSPPINASLVTHVVQKFIMLMKLLFLKQKKSRNCSSRVQYE